MSLSSLTLRLVLAGCSGLLLLGGIAGALTVDASSGPAKAATPLAPNDATPPGGDTPAPAAPGGLDPPAAVPAAPGAAGTTTTTTGATGVAPAPGATTTTVPLGRSSLPGPLVAPKPGDYAYDATSTSSGASRTERATTKVEAAGTEGAATILAVTLPLDLGGQQALTRNTVAFSAGAVVRRSVITVTIFGGPQQLDCVWQPPFAQYAGGLSIGKAWSFDTRCAGKVAGVDVTIQQRASRKVTGAALVTAPGGPVATWTIADDTTIAVTSQIGSGSVHMVGTQSLAPSIGLPVQTNANVTASTPSSAPSQSTLATRLVARP